MCLFFFFFKQKTAYEMRISDWSSDVCSSDLAISEAETRYLCDAVNAYFKRKISPADVVWTYSGVRPLYDDAAESAAAATRDYVLQLDHGAGRAPLLSVFGGKITTFRKLAEHGTDTLEEARGPHGARRTVGVARPAADTAGA